MVQPNLFEDQFELPEGEKIQPSELALAPFNLDGGDGKEITLDQARYLIAWSRRYDLDPFAGHTVFMFGKPYVTEKGALHWAQRKEGYRGFVWRPLRKDEYEEWGIPEDTEAAILCQVYCALRSEPVTEVGYVTHREIVELERKHGSKAQYLPIVKSPREQAKARAIRKAHLRAFPLG